MEKQRRQYLATVIHSGRNIQDVTRKTTENLKAIASEHNVQPSPNAQS